MQSTTPNLEEIYELRATLTKAYTAMVIAKADAERVSPLRTIPELAPEPYASIYREALVAHNVAKSDYNVAANAYNKARDKRYLDRINELTELLDYDDGLIPAYGDQLRVRMMQERFYLRDQWQNGEDKL